MTEPRNTADGPEEITLAELYKQLPHRLTETEPYDVEAGLARFTRWVADQQRDATEPDAQDRPLAVFPTEDTRTGGNELELAASRALTAHRYYDPELTERILELEERKVALEERTLAHAERRADVDYEHEMMRREFEVRSREREHRMELSRHKGLILTRVASVLAFATVYALSIIERIPLLTNGANIILIGYFVLLALALTGVVATRRDMERNRLALEALRLLLFQGREDAATPDEGRRKAARRKAAQPKAARKAARRKGRAAGRGTTENRA